MRCVHCQPDVDEPHSSRANSMQTNILRNSMQINIYHSLNMETSVLLSFFLSSFLFSASRQNKLIRPRKRDENASRGSGEHGRNFSRALHSTVNSYTGGQLRLVKILAAADATGFPIFPLGSRTSTRNHNCARGNTAISADTLHIHRFTLRDFVSPHPSVYVSRFIRL